MPALPADNAGMQYTIRQIPKEVDQALRRRAKSEGKSLNETIISVLQEAFAGNGVKKKYRDLSDIAGTWVEDPEFDKIIEEQRRIDPEDWQ